jgi:hypothetical protein
MIETTEIYDLYWYFAAERQKIFYNRLTGESENLTSDSILKSFRFTNAYRASDRVSQFLIRNVIYSGEQSPQEIFFRTILFRFFNRISTWIELSNALNNCLSYANYDFRLYDEFLTSFIDSGNKIYSAAYIMPSGIREFGFSRKHQNNLKLLEAMMRDHAPERIAEAKNLKNVFQILKSYPTLGDFLAYQYTIDLAYSNFDCGLESDFIVPGPGALRGIRKCFKNTGKLSASEVIHYVADRQQEEFLVRGINFHDLFGRPLQLIDCQNLFCEIDKYARAYSPDLSVGGRSRIKQKFRINKDPIKVFYPPKWKLNDRISKIYYATPDLNQRL